MPRNYQICHLQMNVLLLHPLACSQYGLKFCTTDLPVKLVIERFDINVSRIQIWRNRVQRILTHISIGYVNRVQASFLRQFSGVICVLKPDGRLVVCPGDALAAILLRQFDRFLERDFLSRFFSYVRSRNSVILTVLAPKIAAHGSKRKSHRPGIKMEQRLFLDWVNVNRRYGVVYQRVKFAAMILPDAAYALFPLEDCALMSAGIAFHAPIV